MTTRIAQKPSTRPVTQDGVLDYLNREVSKALEALIDRVNKLIVRGEHVFSAESASDVELDFSDNLTATLTLDQNTTLTLVPPDADSAMLRILFHQPGAFTVTWPADVVWPAGTPPTISSQSTVVLLLYYGGFYYGLA
jgi:hypothetical protein